VSVDTTATIPDAVAVYYDKVFLEAGMDLLNYRKVAAPKWIPPNTGKKIDMFSYRELALLTAALSEGTVPSEENITGFNVTGTVEEWGRWSKASTLFKTAGRDPNLVEYIKVHGRAMKRQFDHLLAIAQATTGGYPIRADNDANYQISGTADSGSTSTLVDDALTQADDYFNGGRGIITGPSSTNYTFCRPVSDFVASSDTVTFCGDQTVGSRTPGLFEADIDTSDIYRLVGTGGLASTDVITSNVIKLCVAILKQNLAPTFEGGFYRALPSVNVGLDLRKDTEFVDFNKYKDYGAYKDNLIDKVWGIEWYETTQPYRQGTGDYSYDADGAVHVVPIFGKNSLAAVGLQKDGKQIVTVKNPGPNDTSQPINRYSTVGWEFTMVAIPTNPLYSVNLFCGSSLSM